MASLWISSLILLFGCASTRPTASIPPSVPDTPGPLRISSEMAAAQLIHRVLPAYPGIADLRAAVTVQAVINKEGRIVNIEILRGHPLLNDRTLSAVSQWRYKPFLQNGRPTDVITTMSVSFDFGRVY